MNYKFKLLLLAITCTYLYVQAGVIHIASFDQLSSIIKSTKNVIIKFYADFCPPCKNFAPLYKQVSEEQTFNSVTFVEVNTQQCPDIARSYGVQSIPMMVFVKDQKNIGTQTGGKTIGQFRALIKSYFSL
ncbi:MAG: thioredoxin family protein [Candidatus Babeliaceae bacterium]|nr:thioredoxin family protein [Candidatus Babeliaceae bacterium]